MSDCVFCKIRDGQIPSVKIDEDERTLTFMDINPLRPGHCLVVTKRHAPTLFDADVEDLQAAVRTAQARRRGDPGGAPAGRPEPLAGQRRRGLPVGAAFHLHLIPRWTNDGKGFDWKLVPGDREAITKTGERLRALLA